MAQDRRITVNEKEDLSEGESPDASQPPASQKPPTQQATSYAQYIRHVQHQKKLVKEHQHENLEKKHEVDDPNSHQTVKLHEPQMHGGQGGETMGDFQSWLIDTGKRLFKILG